MNNPPEMGAAAWDTAAASFPVTTPLERWLIVPASAKDPGECQILQEPWGIWLVVVVVVVVIVVVES